MRCVVTAGPTWEPVDQVRRLTNFSTGRLGGTLANALAAAGHEVTLLLSETASWRVPLAAVRLRTFSTTLSLGQALEAEAGKGAVAVFHAAAVSDYLSGGLWSGETPGAGEPLSSGKADSRGGRLWLALDPTPKWLPRLRTWFPDGFLVGWKYEVDGDRSGAEARGRRQLEEAGTDRCVVNGPAWGSGFGLLAPGQTTRVLPDLEALHEALIGELG